MDQTKLAIKQSLIPLLYQQVKKKFGVGTACHIVDCVHKELGTKDAPLETDQAIHTVGMNTHALGHSPKFGMHQYGEGDPVLDLVVYMDVIDNVLCQELDKVKYAKEIIEGLTWAIGTMALGKTSLEVMAGEYLNWDEIWRSEKNEFGGAARVEIMVNDPYVAFSGMPLPEHKPPKGYLIYSILLGGGASPGLMRVIEKMPSAKIEGVWKKSDTHPILPFGIVRQWVYLPKKKKKK